MDFGLWRYSASPRFDPKQNTGDEDFRCEEGEAGVGLGTGESGSSRNDIAPKSPPAGPGAAQINEYLNHDRKYEIEAHIFQKMWSGRLHDG